MLVESNEIKVFTIGQLFEDKGEYLIPVYQRNYEWGDQQITQLFDDIWDYYIEEESKNYYTGTLIVNCRKDEKSVCYETIDGQQRLTTFNVLICALKQFQLEEKLPADLYKYVEKINLNFESRPNSSKTIRHIFLNGLATPSFLDYNENIVAAIKITIERLNDIRKKLETDSKEERLNSKTFEGFLRYVFDKVVLLRVQVPEETDLNHYFEIMNSRGEQLEKYEILKSRLMKALNEDKNAILLRRQFNLIWQACSQMDTYVQLLFHKDYRTKIFGEKWFDFIPQKFQELSDAFKLDVTDNASEGSRKEIFLSEILEEGNTEELKIKIQELSHDDLINDSDSKQYQQVINFENFLLHVLKLQCPKMEVSLDDKRLLYFFRKALEFKTPTKRCEFVKEFVYNLLKSRFLLDTYIIKRKYLSNEDHWSLETLKFYSKESGTRENDSYNFVKTFEDNAENEELIMLLSMFHVSSPTLVYKHWLFESLSYLNKEFQSSSNSAKELEKPSNIDVKAYKEYLIQVAKKFLKYRFLNASKELSYDEMFENKVQEEEYSLDSELLTYGKIRNNLVFNYIDYLLWSRAEQKIKDFEFSFRSSVEHFFPRNPIVSNEKIEDETILNCMGNLCLISHGNNSRYSNFPPSAKRKHYENSQSKDSIKQMEMMKIEKNTGKWKEKEIQEHNNFIIKLLESNLK